MRGNLGVDAGIFLENRCFATGNYVLFDFGVLLGDYFSGDVI